MFHGSRPEDYQVGLLIIGCLTPCILLIFWIIGSLWTDAVWLVISTVVLVFLSAVKPAIYVEFWADVNYHWPQLWMAEHHETGKGGLKQSDSRARTWYRKAAINGNKDAQYKIARTERHLKNARKWYVMAAKQGHVDAMISM